MQKVQDDTGCVSKLGLLSQDLPPPTINKTTADAVYTSAVVIGDLGKTHAGATVSGCAADVSSGLARSS